MKLIFYKYHGTGNDFILIDNRDKIVSPTNTGFIADICHRRFGVGADGLMLLENAKGYDFRMRYFNADGKEGSMCGNGGRCIVAFANFLGIVTSNAKFIAIDGEHEATINNNKEQLIIGLKMTDVTSIENNNKQFFLDTGSPHFVQFIDSHHNFDTYTEGKKIRYNERFKAVGTNVNFVSFNNNKIQVSTYERGVEDETYSCGTGTVASAICAGLINQQNNFNIITKGGELNVTFNKTNNNHITNIWLTGSAVQVFKGEIIYET